MSNESIDPFGVYLKEVESVAPLTDQEERTLWQTARDGDDAAAAQKRLVEAHLHMVVSIARQFEGQGLLLVDLVQEGNLGLVRAIELFDPGEGRNFSPFASGHIEDAIVSAVARAPNAPLQ